MLENLIIIALVTAAALFVARSLWKRLTGEKKCGGGCGCGVVKPIRKD